MVQEDEWEVNSGTASGTINQGRGGKQWGSGVADDFSEALQVYPCTLHTAPCTLHPAPCTLHPAPYNLHPAPYTLHPTPYTLRRRAGGSEGDAPRTRNPKP